MVCTQKIQPCQEMSPHSEPRETQVVHQAAGEGKDGPREEQP